MALLYSSRILALKVDIVDVNILIADDIDLCGLDAYKPFNSSLLLNIVPISSSVWVYQLAAVNKALWSNP